MFLRKSVRVFLSLFTKSLELTKQIFSPFLNYHIVNADLRPKFLDLKEGAIVVSLKPFAPPSTLRLTERNIDDISAIFDVSVRGYASGTVSWSHREGSYYLHRVDRKGYEDSRMRYEEVHGGRRGGSRRR